MSQTKGSKGDLEKNGCGCSFHGRRPKQRSRMKAKVVFVQAGSTCAIFVHALSGNDINKNEERNVLPSCLFSVGSENIVLAAAGKVFCLKQSEDRSRDNTLFLAFHVSKTSRQ